MMQTQHIALALFLILVTVGIIVVLSITIVVKRRITRRKSRIERNTYTPYGNGLSKVWKENVERKLNATVRVRTEPQAFGTHYFENFDKYIEEGKMTFLYRAKTVDEFLKLKRSIMQLCPDLEAPPIRGILAFLMAARDQAMYPPASRDRIEEYCRLYLSARHDINPFGEADYRKFCELQASLMELVSRAAAVRESASSNPPSGHLHRSHSTKFPPLNRIAPNPKVFSTILTGSEEVSLTSPTSPDKIEHLRSDKAGSGVGSKPNTGGALSFKRLSHTHRKGHELLVSLGDNDDISFPKSSKSSRRAHKKDLDEVLGGVENVSADPKNDEGAAHVDGGGRRSSCQSDGSQTALIDLDPECVVSKTAAQGTRYLRSDSFGAVEMRPILPHPKGSSSDADEATGGMENEGVNC